MQNKKKTKKNGYKQLHCPSKIFWIKSKKLKSCGCLIDDGKEDKVKKVCHKKEGTKKCVIQRKLKFEDYNNCLETAQIENEINPLEKTKLIYINS